MAVSTAGSRHVAVIGGGIAGLAAAYYLQKGAEEAGMPLSYTLLERERLGGKVVTERADGFVVEGGPDSFLRRKPWAAELCRELGIGGELVGTNDGRRRTFVLDGGRLKPLPDGVMLVIPTRIAPFVTSSLISWPGKARMGMDVLIPPRRGDGDESVADFVRRRLGQEALDKIAQPLMGGIHVSDPEKQSLLGTFPSFRDIEVKYGSLIRGMLAAGRAARSAKRAPDDGPSSAFITARGGLGQIIEALEGALTGRVLPGVGAVGLDRREGGGYRIRSTDGGEFEADAVILATPAFVSAALVGGILPALADALGGIRYVSTATVSLGFRLADMNRRLDGFGFVVPRGEGRRISGCTWSSTKFFDRAPDDMALLRCFIGGPGQEEFAEMGQEEMIAMSLEELGDIMGLNARPAFARVFRWHRGNPQYDVGHLDRVRDMHALCETRPGLFVTGSAFDGVGLPDCTRQGKEAAQKVLSFLRAF